MRSRDLFLTAALLAFGAGGAVARSEVQAGDTVKKEAGSDRVSPKARGSQADRPKSGVDLKPKAPAKEKDAARDAKQPEGTSSTSPAGRSREKVDVFIDRDHDGIDDRHQSKVKRRELPAANAPSEERSGQAPVVPADTTSRRPPR